MVVKLWEALKISKIREAVGRRRIGGQEIMFFATDGGISVSGRGCVQGDIVVAPWADLLPQQRNVLNQINWQPVDPKSPLILLAEAVTDFQGLEPIEDESGFSNPEVN